MDRLGGPLMCKFAIVFGFLLMLFGSGSAQAQETPQWEIFGGYSFFRVDAGSVTLSNGTLIKLQQNSNGWHASLAENVTSWFGGVADFSGHYANRTFNFSSLGIPPFRANLSAYPFLFGPQFSHRKLGSAVLFGHALVGGVHARANISGGTQPIHDTKWAYGFGGGFDYKLTRQLAARAQVDWIRSHFPETLTRDFQNNVRASGGLVLRIGRK
jgi:opacity protein-like surface antigen